MKAGPGRGCGIGAPGTQDIQGGLGVGEKTVPEVVRKVGMSGREDVDEMVFSCPYCPLCRTGSVSVWGTNVTGNRCEIKYSWHSNEVSLSTMRLSRGSE